VRGVTTTRKPATRSRRRSRASGPAPAALPAEGSFETPLDTFLEQPAAPETVASAAPEPAFAARVPPPEPERPRPTLRRAIFFDVENSSRADHVARILTHLEVDRTTRVTELVAVGNWRVINHETARLLAQRGAHLVHSAPAAGVRDWSDLRIAVSAGVWLAAARSGDVIEIVTDDQAFDAVGDVATSLGVDFRRLSFRALAGAAIEEVREEPARQSRSRRRRRGGRRGRGAGTHLPPAAAVAPQAANGAELGPEAHTAPHDELLAVARELLSRAPERTVSIDALSNALKAHGFRRTPGSPRLITRLRRIKELEVGRTGAIRLVNDAPAEATPESVAPDSASTEGPAPGAGQRRRRRRGGRRRRGRGGSAQAVIASP
jgi:hypothetical protein